MFPGATIYAEAYGVGAPEVDEVNPEHEVLRRESSSESQTPR
jgi:hypothetical protein